MRKRRLPVPERLLLALALGVGLYALGTTYAAWTTSLSIRTDMRTGIFNMIFPDSGDGDYYAWITDENESSVEELEIELSVSKDGKQAELAFTGGLPVELLAQGYYIKVAYPLEQAENNTINQVEYVEPDLDEPGEKVRMKVKSGTVMVDGTSYGLEEILEPFMIPLNFYVYKGVVREEDDLTGYLYMKLTEESQRDIEDMPKVFELDAEDLEGPMDMQEDFANLAAIAENGVIMSILVSFHCI